MDQNSTIIICSSCGVPNNSTNSSCSGCGSTLALEKRTVTVSSPATKSMKAEASAVPLWLKGLLGVFIIFAVSMVIIEGIGLPSGSVQRSEQSTPQETSQAPIDPAIINKISELEKQLSANPNDAETILQFANTLHDAKFYPRAIELYKKYVILNPSNNDAQVDLGICYFETGNLDQAVTVIESVIKKDPKHQMAMFNLGIIQLSSQNIVEAKKWFKKCITIDPQSTAGLRAQQILEQH